MSVRTVVNEMQDGRQIKYMDPQGGAIRWRVTYVGLTDDEKSRIEQFFELTEGPLSSFIFLDPMDNLLASSEQFGDATWRIDPMLNVTEGIGDPMGTSRATRLANPGLDWQGVTQTLTAPGWFRYTLSVSLRADGGSHVRLVRAAGANLQAQEVTAVSTWQRILFNAEPGGSDELLEFQVLLAPGTTVDVFGPQLESGFGGSTYKLTSGDGGARVCRFDQDSLSFVTNGPNDHAVTLRLRTLRRR